MFALAALGIAAAALAAPAAHAWNLFGTQVNVPGWAVITQGPRQAQVVAEAYWTGSGGFIFNYNGADMDLALTTNCTGTGWTPIAIKCDTTNVGDNISHICPSPSSVVSAMGNLQATVGTTCP